MDYDSKPFTWSMIPYSASLNVKCEKSFWVFHPVYGKNSIKEVSEFPDPIMLNLKNLKLHNEGLTAEIVGTNEKMVVSKTEKEVNIAQYYDHLNKVIAMDLELKAM